MRNSAEVLWTVKGIKTVLGADIFALSVCEFVLDILEQSKWRLFLSTNTKGFEVALSYVSSSKKQLEVDFDIRLITAEGKRWKTGFVGKKEMFTSDNSLRSGPIANWVEMLDASTGLMFGGSVRLSIRFWPSQSSLPFPVSLSARSSVGIPRKATWKVDNFSCVDAEGKREYVVPKQSSCWEIKFILFLHQEEVCVRVNSGNKYGLMMEAVHIVQKNGARVTCWEGKMFLNRGCETCHLPFIKKSSLYENHVQFLPDDILTVILEYVDYNNHSNCSANKCIAGKNLTNATSACSSHSDLLKLPISLPSFSRTLEDFSILLDKATFSDFQIKVGKESIPVHKNILCSRSPVFEAMLASPMRESCENSVNVPDFEPDSVRRLLRFLYSGSVPT